MLIVYDSMRFEMRASERPSCCPGPTSVSATRTKSAPDTASIGITNFDGSHGCDSTPKKTSCGET